MFGAGPAATAVPGGGAVKKGLLDNYDDVEGYYNFQASLSLVGSSILCSRPVTCARDSTSSRPPHMACVDCKCSQHAGMLS